KLCVRVSGKRVIRLFANEEIPMLTQPRANPRFIDDAVGLEPEQTQHVGITFQEQTDELFQFVKDTVPLAFPSFVDVPTPETKILFEWTNVDAHHVLVVDRIRIRF